MAEGRGWHGGRVIGRGRDTPPRREKPLPRVALYSLAIRPPLT